MCLIAVRRKEDEKLHEKYYDAARIRNSDGIGIMYVKDGRVVAKKAEGKTAVYLKKELYQEFADAPVPSCLHLRFGTAGNKDDKDNAHPFQILKLEDDGVDLYMMHNGHFSGVTRVDPTKSDTWHFAHLYIKKLVKKNPYILCDPFIQSMIKDYTKGSRVVFLYSCGTKIILDDGTGCEPLEKGGAWLSNRYTTDVTEYTAPAKTESKIKPYDPDDWGDDYCQGYGDRYSHYRKTDNFEPNKYKDKDKDFSNVKNIKSQAELEEARSKYPLAIKGDDDTDSPDIEDAGNSDFELPETVEEALECMAGMTDNEIKELVEVQPEDVISLLLTFRDYYLYHNTNPLLQVA